MTSAIIFQAPVIRKDPIEFNLDFNYFNSSSAKYILDFCKKIASSPCKMGECKNQMAL